MAPLKLGVSNDTKTEGGGLVRRVLDVASRGRHGATVSPVAAPDPTSRADCVIQIVPLTNISALIKCSISTRATTKRTYVNGAAEGISVVDLIRIDADRGARLIITLCRISPVASSIAVPALVVRRLVPLVLIRHPICRTRTRIRVDAVGDNSRA